MKVAALQMVSGMDLQANLRVARALLAEAAGQGAELALLPEYFGLLGPNERSKLGVQESAGQGSVQDFLARAARDFKLWLVGGTMPISTADPQRVRNASLVYGPGGDCVARYDKIHLFRFKDGQHDHDESRTLEPGEQPVAFELPSSDGHCYRVGLSVCYDLRFPELYRRLKADLLLVPSAFTFTTGQAHWELLLRARAVENLAYVLAAAQGGLHDNGRRTWGRSMLVEPWGTVLAQQAEGAGVVMGEVRQADLQTLRQQLPALGHGVL